MAREQSGHPSVKVLNLLYLGAYKRGSDISALLLPSGNGEKRETTACIRSSLRVKYCSAQRCWHHLTLPRRRVLASFSGLADHRSEDGPVAALILFLFEHLRGQQLQVMVAIKTKTLFLLAFSGKNFFHNLWKHNVARKLKCECEFRTLHSH